MQDSTIVMIILTIIQVPSFFCAVQILRFNLHNKDLRETKNHLIICLLIVSIWAMALDLPFTQAYLWSGSVPISTSWACILGNISFMSVTGLNRVLMAFLCVERHFLIFRPQLYRTHRSRFFIHYLPLAATILYVLIYFIVTNTVITCSDMIFNYSRYLCGFTCSIRSKTFGVVFTWLEVFVPVAIIIVGSILLPVRFIIQKNSIQRVQWHRTRKMIVHTSLIAGIYIICWFPYTVVVQLLVAGLLSFDDPSVGLFVIFESYATSLLTPFIIQHTIPGWANMKWIKRIEILVFPQRRPHPPSTGSVPQQRSNLLVLSNARQRQP